MAPEMMPSGTLSRKIALALKAALARSALLPIRPAMASGGTAIRAWAPLLATRKQTTPASPRCAVAVLGEADRDADGEQQAEIVEDRIARGGDERDRQQVRLAQPQQQPRHRQHGDRQH